MYSHTLDRDIDLSGVVTSEELEAVYRDMEDPYMASGIRNACETMIRREMGGGPSSCGEDDARHQFEGWND